MTLPDIDSLSTYGGALTNYAPVTDPTTDRDAAAENQAYATAAAITRTAKLAWARFVCNATTPTLTSHDAVWGTSTPPVVTHGGTGQYLLTWPGTVTDELGAMHAVDIRRCTVSVEGPTPFRVQGSLTANSVTVFTFNTSFVPNDLVGTTILVEAG